jgi:penicillin-binding protein 2
MNNDSRKYVIALMVLLVSFIFTVRLFYMQVIDDQWKDRAAEISENKVVTQPAGELFTIGTKKK